MKRICPVAWLFFGVKVDVESVSTVVMSISEWWNTEYLLCRYGQTEYASVSRGRICAPAWGICLSFAYVLLFQDLRIPRQSW